MTSRQSVFHTSSAPKTKKLHPLRSLPLVVTNPHAPYFSAFWRTMATQQQPIGTGQVLPPLPQPPPLTYRRTRGQSPKPHGFKPFCEKISSYVRRIFLFLCYSYMKSNPDNDSCLSIYKTIPAICNTPCQTCVYRILFFHTSSRWLRVVGRVVVCGCVSVR